MDSLLQTFLDLAAIDEVHPNENQVLAYVRRRLDITGVPYEQDAKGNLVARIEGESDEAVALSGHVDIAAPLQDRQIIIDGDTVRTDGKSLLGGDDKTAVAAMLELADDLHARQEKPARTLEFIFSVGEEAGMKGSIALDFGLVRAKQVLVLDWLGGVNHIVTQSPAYYGVDVTYTGADAHPAQWQQGKNAGAALMQVASTLQQGQFAPEVIFNIGIVRIGDARNKLPGHAELKAEIRSYDKQKADAAADAIGRTFTQGAQQFGIDASVSISRDVTPYRLDRQSALLADVSATLAAMRLEPVYESTYGCFDGNIFTAHGLDVVMLGAAYYNPHSPGEYVSIPEFRELFRFLQQFIAR